MEARSAPPAPELMDCQFCAGPAFIGQASGYPPVFTVQAQCHKCGMRGPPAFDQAGRPGSGAIQAVLSWNRLQALVAKGLLWDAPLDDNGGPLTNTERL